ncbi:hypothetical protein VIGAN_01068500 [Vigna angularis var. angularis]|uniref:Uncharacterized protein n=1 Tax=Vigna angularis var. angularis TaxID=157739 RepID=A0A0S3QY51_PHAAN|nr:hypothetical protein VIGAN_01068500 [Vigna angularis var. angularis]
MFYKLPPHKVWNEISKMLIIGESVPNGFNVSIDRNFSLNSPFPPRNHLNLTLHFTELRKPQCPCKQSEKGNRG